MGKRTHYVQYVKKEPRTTEFACTVFKESHTDDLLETDLVLNDKNGRTTVDTGSGSSFSDKRLWIALGRPKLHPAKVQYVSPNDRPLRVKGRYNAMATLSDCTRPVMIEVNMATSRGFDVLGREALRKLDIDVTTLLRNDTELRGPRREGSTHDGDQLPTDNDDRDQPPKNYDDGHPTPPATMSRQPTMLRKVRCLKARRSRPRSRRATVDNDVDAAYGRRAGMLPRTMTLRGTLSWWGGVMESRTFR